MPPQNNNPYDFITNPQQTANKQLRFGNSTKQRALLVGGGLLLLIIIAMIFSALLSAGSNAQKDRLLSIAQAQTEIIRVVTLAEEKSNDSATLAKASIVKLSIQSALQDSLSLLEARGSKPSEEDLSAALDNSTDNTLNQAAASNRFEDSFGPTVDQLLRKYQQLLKDAYDNGDSSEKDILDVDFEDVETIVSSSSNPSQ